VARSGQGLTRRRVVTYHGTYPLVATQRGRKTRKRISLSPQAKDRPELADRAQARQSAPDQSAYPFRSQTCQ
jgi:hypothetical protein